jgi:hypothetical protein
MKERMPTPQVPPDTEIRRVLEARSKKEGYPLTEADVEKHSELLITLIREKILTLAGMSDETPLTTIEALNHVLMSQRWLRRNEMTA